MTTITVCTPRNYVMCVTLEGHYEINRGRGGGGGGGHVNNTSMCSVVDCTQADRMLAK